MRILVAALLCVASSAMAGNSGHNGNTGHTGTTGTTHTGTTGTTSTTGTTGTATTTPASTHDPVPEGAHTAQGGAPTKAQCKQYNQGAGILDNISKRYWQHYTPSSPEDNTGLQKSMLFWMAADAKASSNILLARIHDAPSTEECKAVKESGAKLAAEYAAEWPIAEAAYGPCEEKPEAQKSVKACATAVKPLFEKERTIKKDGGPLQSFMSTWRAHASCLAFSEDEKLLFERMGKEPMERDARGVQIRIGKMREAREHLAKVKDVPVLKPFVEGAKQLLIAGEGGPCPGGAGAGAEHILWCLRDHPENDNEQLFAATAQVGAAAILVSGYDCKED